MNKETSVFLDFTDVQKLLNLSPGMLLDILNQGKIRTNLDTTFNEYMHDHSVNQMEYSEIGEVAPFVDDFFTEQNAKDIRIHRIDLEKAIETYPEIDRNVTNTPKVSSHGVPHFDNSIWLSVDDLEFRWGVKRFDIITRLRSGELGSNMYDKNSSPSIFVSPSECYPIEKILEFACHLHKHIWPYEEEFIQLKRHAADKYNEYVDRYEGKGLIKFVFKDDSLNRDSDDSTEGNYCSSFDYIRRTNFEGWMSGPDALKLLNIGPSRFIDVLNRGLIKTSQESQRISHYNKEEKKKVDIWMKDCITYTLEPFFCIGSIEYILINAYDIADALKGHEELSDIVLSDKAPLSLDCRPPLRGDLPDDFHDSISAKSNDCEGVKSRIAELEVTNVALQAKIAELETAKGAQETTDQNGKPRTASATEAAQATRVEEWKGYAGIMAKVAYDCGLEDRTQVTRSAYEKLARRHGGLSKQALELLRDALPDGVTKKTGGPAPQG